MFIHRILLAALIHLTCYATLNAQAQKPQKISVRTMALGTAEMPKLYFRTKGEEKLTPVHWSKRQPSRTVDALYEGSLPLYRLEKGEDGKSIPVVARRVKLPQGAREILLFGWQSKDKLKLVAIGDNFLSAKHSDWMLINLSSKSIDFLVGRESKPIRVDSGQTKPYQIKVDQDKGAAVYGKANIRGQEQIFYSTFLPIRSQRRTILIFSDNGDKIRTTPVADLFSRRPPPPE